MVDVVTTNFSGVCTVVCDAGGLERSLNLTCVLYNLVWMRTLYRVSSTFIGDSSSGVRDKQVLVLYK